jgi:hypothetical protein
MSPLITNDDTQFRPLLDSLRGAQTFLEMLKSEPVLSAHVPLAQEVAVYSILRTEELLRAIVLLLENRMVLGAMPLVRMLLEMAFNLGWIGGDNVRAEQFRDAGLQEAKDWIGQARQGKDIQLTLDHQKWLEDLLATQSGKPRLPSRRERANEVEFASAQIRSYWICEEQPKGLSEKKQSTADCATMFPRLPPASRPQPGCAPATAVSQRPS